MVTAIRHAVGRNQRRWNCRRIDDELRTTIASTFSRVYIRD